MQVTHPMPSMEGLYRPTGAVHSQSLRRPGWGPASAEPPHALCFQASLNAPHMPLSAPGPPHQFLPELQPFSTALLQNRFPSLSFPLPLGAWVASRPAPGVWRNLDAEALSISRTGCRGLVQGTECCGGH